MVAVLKSGSDATSHDNVFPCDVRRVLRAQERDKATDFVRFSKPFNVHVLQGLGRGKLVGRYLKKIHWY